MADNWKKTLEKNFGGQRQNNNGQRSSGQNYPKQSNLVQQRNEGGNASPLVDKYLEGGYFDEKGYLKVELLTDQASHVAKGFGTLMTSSQLRRFYGHAKTAEKSFLYTNDESKFILDIVQLRPAVADAKSKGKVPNEFFQFIEKNITTIRTVKDIRKGFLPHFQAVVAYFNYWYPKSW